MTAREFRESLETEREWRSNELAFFKRQLNFIPDEADKDRYRKGLVLILYSHWEGFVRFALQSYVDCLNMTSVVNTESNLWYRVLKKNLDAIGLSPDILYKIGWSPDRFEHYQTAIDGLVERRNVIAHGVFRNGVYERDFAVWERQISLAMTDITIMLYNKYTQSGAGEI